MKVNVEIFEKKACINCRLMKREFDDLMKFQRKEFFNIETLNSEDQAELLISIAKDIGAPLQAPAYHIFDEDNSFDHWIFGLNISKLNDIFDKIGREIDKEETLKFLDDPKVKSEFWEMTSVLSQIEALREID